MLCDYSNVGQVSRMKCETCGKGMMSYSEFTGESWLGKVVPVHMMGVDVCVCPPMIKEHQIKYQEKSTDQTPKG